MATLAFAVAGQFVGGLVGGSFGATVGRALGALAGSVVDDALFGESSPTPVGPDIRLQGSSEGRAIPRIYGWNRVVGNIIWATELERIDGQSSGAKGSDNSTATEATITANFAIALCEGEVTRLGRIWADGELLDTEGLNVRFYSGSETQLADSLIAAKQGAGATPAYRGICYLVFERLPLEPFGNRIPNISVELTRTTGDLEQDISAITIIPGATEFGYDPTARVRIVSPGAVVSENAHMVGQVSNWTLSIDELQSLCPNLQHVSLVVSWFGDDLRCGSCNIQPRVEGADRTIKGTEWVVNGIDRASAQVVTSFEGGPAYGGTPSDNAVLAAIADLKARGINVTLYPIVLMDIATDNVLTNPYTQDPGQPAYPWRGRITCDPAPGQPATPDMSAAIDAPVSAFTGGAGPGDFTAAADTINYAGSADWGYRRMVLHYAHLAQLAGGVDAIIIGSELRGLTTLRRDTDEFPFVEALVNLAADVRSVVGGGTKITYAADWSEYSGYQPVDAPGDKLFHLDPLWSSANIDAVGIDNYMPLSDWRDGSGHADAALATSPHDIDYLQANIAGGEGFDWYYASDADRETGTRTDIADGAYGEPFVWRTKDLVNWWGSAHYNRIGGVRAPTPTSWVPQEKSFWFTELGCGAVDKGPNLPSAFGDSKSSEDARPYFSSGAPDTLVQRQFLRAHHQWWRPDAAEFLDAHNPVSSVYGQRMVDPERIYLWTWDARPYPAFPNLQEVWADGVNHATGHWLTGRLGALSAAELIAAIAKDYGTTVTASFSGGIKIDGLQIEGIVSMRNAIASLLEAANLTILDRQGGLVVSRVGGEVVADLSSVSHVDNGNVIASRKRPDSSAAIGHLALSYFDRQHSYLTGTATAIALQGEGGAQLNSGLVIDNATARVAAERALARAMIADEVVEFSLPPSLLELEVGDVVSIDDQRDGPFVITELRDGSSRRVTARAVASQTALTVVGNARVESENITPATGEPLVVMAHLPSANGSAQLSRLVIGAVAKPWPGEVVIKEVSTGTDLAVLTQSATIGTLLSPLAAADGKLWDRSNTIEVQLHDGHVASVPESAALAGNNRAVVARDDGTWEVIGFADALLISEVTYQLSNLLRGLEGTSDPTSAISSGNAFMLLNSARVSVEVSPERLGGTFALEAFAGRSDAEGTSLSVVIGTDPLLPLAPAQQVASRDQSTNDVTLTWIRRARRNGNSWTLIEVPLDNVPEAYRIEIFSGSTLVRSTVSAIPTLTYLAADQVTDFGSPPSSFNFTIAQISPTFGVGHLATGVFNG